MYQSPPLYKTSSTGAELAWNIFTRPFVDDDGPVPAILYHNQPWEIVTIHGQLGGKAQTTIVKITSGKNVGRANATSIEEQADSEAKSKYAKQLDKGYSTERGGASKERKPMLAHSYDDHKKKVTYPAFIQPKLDGMRCIAIKENGVVSLVSRGNKPIDTMPHICEELGRFMDEGETLDGELYNHDITFQSAMSLIKKAQPGSEKIEYHIYDVIAPGSFRDRFLTTKMLNLDVMEDHFHSLKLVPTYTVRTEAEIIEWHNRFVAAGYEGAILRILECLYKEGGRSNNLLKVKQFFDGEFTIVDVIPGDRSPTHGIFVCQMTDTDVTFSATPEGTFELKEQYLRERDKLIGKQLTVRYFEMTTSEVPVPRFPIAVGVRDYE